jgi:hypothetical protein
VAEHASPLPVGEPAHADGPTATPSEPAHRADANVGEVLGRRARHRRRVTTEPPVGSDPAPDPEPPRHSSTENDEQLKRDKPPHWA